MNGVEDYDWVGEKQAALAEEKDRVQRLRAQLVTTMHNFLCYCAVVGSAALGSESLPSKTL